MLFSLPIRPARGRGRAGAGAGAAALAVALLLGGCTGSPEPSASPSPNSTQSATEPVFESDEEALAAAVEAYEKYRAASAEISMDGGKDADRIRPFVTSDYAETVIDEFHALEEAGLRMTGTTSVDTTSLASWSQTDKSADVSIYFCRDVSGARATNAHGEDVTPRDRDERVPLQAFLVSSDQAPEILVISGVDQWTGDDFC